MTTTLRAALLRLIVNAGSYGKMAAAYRSLDAEELTWREREIVADLFNALIHHRAMTEEDAA
jgi:hypothetical protein